MKNILLIACILLVMESTALARELPMNPEKFSPDWIFSIENNLNTSSVVYALITSNSKMIGSQPVYNYMHRKSGTHPRELNFFEQSMAFGIRSQKKEGDTKVYLVLDKYPKIPITVEYKGNRARGYVKLKNREYQLVKIYVKAKEGLLGTSIKYVKLILVDRRTGKETYHMVKK